MVNAEDAHIFEALRSVFPSIARVDAQSMREWLDVMRHAACVVTARFHHTLAAVSLGTPCMVFPSNTPKTNASMKMLGMNRVLDIQQDLEAMVINIELALAQKLPSLEMDRINSVLHMAAQNFVGLDADPASVL